ncbi:Heme oxygenase [Marinospirillum celere]|uniref:Heme oxygenase n=1 Tax=Marinospirillum celere TaxID=1122252 RepID=A0A1I1EBF8_9GAMM|nr:biliverdin-producing heme oxygenase [Marinospirillum celere]SFB84451.1 Heme oxygenase [Marinospirillum celere]
MSLIYIPKLRKATHWYHQQLESLPPLQRVTHPELTLGHYRDLLKCFFHIYLHLEEQIYPYFCQLTRNEFNWNGFMASPRLAKDLVHLCQPLPGRHLCHEHPINISNLPQALGCCYVLLGSGFGAKKIGPLVKQNLGELTPIHFYEEGQPYLKSLWHQLEDLISIYSAEVNDMQETIEAAIATFQFFNQQIQQAFHPVKQEVKDL